MRLKIMGVIWAVNKFESVESGVVTNKCDRQSLGKSKIEVWGWKSKRDKKGEREREREREMTKEWKIEFSEEGGERKQDVLLVLSVKYLFVWDFLSSEISLPHSLKPLWLFQSFFNAIQDCLSLSGHN
jgi:hypothetical protein